MASPIKDGKITTPYGKPGKMWKNGHTGVDYAVPQGTDVLAAIAGVVTPSNWGKAYGNQLVIKSKFDDKDIWVMYAHLSKLLVKVGDSVTAGQHIAESGNTGNSSGPHLHFEVRNGARWSTSKAQDPKGVLEA
jgi:murein DD-endopeptidase MepM/ murein hydrolase activator NlpD